MAKNLRLKVAQAEHDMTQGDLAEAGCNKTNHRID
ncbi:Predicted protein [Streptococcus thermophilus LMD-9]|nr:Predicted protein [Streptococcus thermophilus LMD-9]